jgi:glycosyltransferase involved in cell wall biosynthesis
MQSWYVHKAVDLKLRIATIFANIIFSSTKDSFRIKTDKVRYVGHGIDTNLFHCENIFETHASHIVILHVGRITQIKDISTLIKAVDQIKKTGKSVEVKLIGDPVYEKDKMYLNELKAEIKSLDLEREFHFLGGMPQDKIIAHMCSSHIMVNMTPTGGMDKAVIEAMSCGRPVVTSNEAFREVFGNMAEKLIFRYGDSVDLKNKIMEISRLDKTTMPDELRWIATHNFSINELVYKICEILKS